MEQSLFTISLEIESIFDELEENGGELTPELEARIAISQENLIAKLGSYVNAVKFMDEKIEATKKEKERITAFAKSYTNKRERLVGAITDAVSKYGAVSKTGSKFIELMTCKLSIRKSQAVEINEPLVAAIKNIVYTYLVDFYQNSKNPYKKDVLKMMESNLAGRLTQQDIDRVFGRK